ncbi:hypothetical protein LXL04_007295 [Taraxacum kok-saghyz]
MTIRFSMCATTWHLHDPKLPKLRKPSEVPPAPQWVFILKPSTPMLPPIPRLANPNLGYKSKISLPSEHVPSESFHSESSTTFVSITASSELEALSALEPSVLENNPKPRPQA